MRVDRRAPARRSIFARSTRASGAVAGAWVFLLAAAPVLAQSPDSASTYRHDHAPQIRAARLEGSVRIDGVPDEPAWSRAEPVTAFTQLDPQEGQPVSEATEVRVLIGDDALYVGAWLRDREPHQVKARLARRDDPVEADAFEVSVDSYHDHLTAKRFRVSAGGAIRDAVIGANGDEDDSWDGVWEGASHVDGSGWTAEIKIPLSQLRYSRQADAVWGLQLARVIFRKGETAYFAFTPKKEQGGVSRYGHLTGLGLLPATRRLEVIPYASTKNEHDQFDSRGGSDVKYGLTSDLTLDLTVNPDFGQVEVDPAEVNLTAFETFFPERRPFFVEGADLFQFGRSRAFNNFGVPTIFHSRRIGRAPQLQAGSGFDVPSQTTIGGAAKLTGRTRGGWAVGMIDAITTHEDAHFTNPLGVKSELMVEPTSHYFAGRLRRDLRGGNTVLGVLATATDRRLDDPTLQSLLRSDAFIAGVDLGHAWADRKYAFDAAVTGSSVRGSETAIAATQRASSRYFQRPDHGDYAAYDPTRTQLQGYGIDASIAKTSGTHWLGSLAYVSRSPGYEANDLGFQTRADYRGFSSIVLYQENRPNRWFRNYTVFPYVNQMLNFGGDLVFNAYALQGNGTFANFWSFNTSLTLNRSVLDDRQTRGGPQGRSPENGNWAASITTDSRKSWSISADFSHAWNEAGGSGDFPSISASFRPSPTLRLRLEPTFSTTHALAQYITAVPDTEATATYGSRYVFSTLDQKVVSLVTRVDWTMTPRLSLQLYLQPLVVSGAFSSFKELVAPRRFDFDVYGRQRGTITPFPGGYTVDPGNGATFELPNPDFNFRSLLGNAVLRWEYRPGSTLFFVWQQSRVDEQPFGDFDFSRDYKDLLDRSPENVFAVKASWWVGL